MLPSVTKWQEANFLIGKQSKNSKLDNDYGIPDQCKATLDVADSNGWIPFAQNADTIEKAIVAKQTSQLHPATEICISSPPNLTVFH
jgi:hypothetical protein